MRTIASFLPFSKRSLRDSSSWLYTCFTLSSSVAVSSSSSTTSRGSMAPSISTSLGFFDTAALCRSCHLSSTFADLSVPSSGSTLFKTYCCVSFPSARYSAIGLCSPATRPALSDAMDAILCSGSAVASASFAALYGSHAWNRSCADPKAHGTTKWSTKCLSTTSRIVAASPCSTPGRKYSITYTSAACVPSATDLCSGTG
mmetsp:Transcript_13544/g.46802  ORF Transcript_13544/g.46802 Transcript_13544/m.46802 type:complete len:201 (+) Transcript_13544:1498-2100(+)